MPETKEGCLALPFGGSTVAEKLVEKTGTLGEKLEVSGYHKIVGENIASYVHAGSKIGVLVSYKDGGNAEAPDVKIVGSARPAPATALVLSRPRRVRSELDMEILP